jgi:hypothetical protein
MPNQRKKGKRKFQSWLTEEQHVALAALAKSKGVTMTEVLTQVVDAVIESKKTKTPKQKDT